MSDNGSAYISGAFRQAVAALGARHLRTRPYTPRTNGKAERFIQTMLRLWAYDGTTSWEITASSAAGASPVDRSAAERLGAVSRGQRPTRIRPSTTTAPFPGCKTFTGLRSSSRTSGATSTSAEIRIMRSTNASRSPGGIPR